MVYFAHNKFLTPDEVAMKTLDDYVKELKTEDLIEAAHTAKVQSHALLEDQGISTLALMISELIVDFIEEPERLQNRLK